MAVDERKLAETGDLRTRLRTLEETQRATLNILEDFDEEKVKLTQVQQASMNLLEDFNEERRKYQLIQKATLNLLEDVNEERSRLDDTQRALVNMLEDFEKERVKAEQVQQATMNLLEDFDEERRKYQFIQSATLNLLEDFDEERQKYELIQKATLNLLEDFDGERRKYQLIQQATLNLLEDVNDERNRLNETQRALMNMLEDFESERARAEHSRALVESANKELEAFSYSVSHDLRAPLRAIDGFSNALLRHYPDSIDARGQDYLQRIRAGAQRMARLIDDILSLSRASRAEMHRQKVNLSQMSMEVLSELQRSQPLRRAEIIVAPDLVVDADANLLRIMLDNLLGNSWKFTGKRDVARIEVGTFVENGERVYFVKDNGAGFNPTYADQLFSPFQRLHTEDEFPGTGIGLALVLRVLRRHGGRIWAESEVNRGASFYFTLGERVDERT